MKIKAENKLYAPLHSYYLPGIKSIEAFQIFVYLFSCANAKAVIYHTHAFAHTQMLMFTTALGCIKKNLYQKTKKHRTANADAKKKNKKKYKPQTPQLGSELVSPHEIE